MIHILPTAIKISSHEESRLCVRYSRELRRAHPLCCHIQPRKAQPLTHAATISPVLRHNQMDNL